MTLAICLRCGDRKVGALTQCPGCGSGPSGDLELDILFSDHQMSHGDLDHFSEVIRKINSATSGFPGSFRAFMVHVGTQYPELLTIVLPEEEVGKMEKVLEGLDLEVRDLELRSPREWGNLGARPIPTGLVLALLSVIHLAWARSLEPVDVSPLLYVRYWLIGSLAMFLGIAAVYQFREAWRSWREDRSSP